MMSFLLSFMGLLNILTVRVEWIYHTLNIRLGENIHDFFMLPEARLYIDDVLILDSLMFYERDGVERTFQSTINTNVVKKYVLKYRVTFPTHNISHVQSIYFNVIDDIPPVIVQTPLLEVPVGTKLPDLKIGLVYYDNYDDNTNLTVLIDSSRVVNSKIGNYLVIYQIRDLSGNLCEKTMILKIIDHLPPEITLKKDIILSFGANFNWRDFFTVKDNYDLVPSVEIDTSGVDFSRLGNYLLSITATDSSGLQSKIFQEVTIVDITAPTIVMKSQPALIPVFSMPDFINFIDYILYVDDNYDTLRNEDVNIWHDIEFNTVGKYKIYYQLTDFSGNMKELILNVQVVDQECPTITVHLPFVFDVFSTEPHLINHFSFTDNYTNQNELNYKITSVYKMNVAGSYPITIEVTDQFGNKGIYRGYIEIVDRVSPTILQVNDIIISEFRKKDIFLYFLATDNYYTSNKLVLEIDDHQVNYERIGSYIVFVTATDPSLNVGTIEAEVIVIDMIDPILKLNQTSATIEINAVEINFFGYISEASDNYDYLTKYDVEISHNIDYGKLGVYPVTFSLEDSSKNVSTVLFHLIIDDRLPPTIEVPFVSLKVGQIFNPLEGITVSDNLGSYKIEYFPFVLDTSIPGTKTVTYIVTDSRGNYTMVLRTIEIEQKDQKIAITSFIPVVLVTFLGIGAIYYFWKKLS